MSSSDHPIHLPVVIGHSSEVHFLLLNQAWISVSHGVGFLHFRGYRITRKVSLTGKFLFTFLVFVFILCLLITSQSTVYYNSLLFLGVLLLQADTIPPFRHFPMVVRTVSSLEYLSDLRSKDLSIYS